MNKKNLSNNKGAMLALEHMSKNGLSDKDISQKLYDSFGHLWDTSTIGRRRRGLGVLREMPASFCKPLKSVTAIKNSKKRLSATNKTQMILEDCFGNVNPDDLLFGDLCEYTASFFEGLANHPKGEPSPQEWWDTARDKVIHWHTVLERTKANISKLNKSQLRAYDYCKAMYHQSITGGRYYREVYSLYREWRLVFIEAINYRRPPTIRAGVGF